MSTQKKVLDALKEELKPVTGSEEASITGGYASGTADMNSDTDDMPVVENVPCNQPNGICNTLAGCAGPPGTVK